MIEQQIIEECRKGDLQNFREVVRVASPFAFSVAFRILGDEELAKDIVQDTMVTVWQKLDKIKSTENFKTWLYKIVVNKCYDQLRRRKREPDFRPDEKTWELISNHIADQPALEIGNEEIGKLLDFLTKRLSPKQKTVFILSEIEEMSSSEISEITGLSKTIIKANLYLARKHISGMMEKYF